MIRQQTLNLFNAYCNVIAHQVNCIGVTGGLAGDIFEKYPECYEPYHYKCKSQDPKGTAQLLPCKDGRILANLFGQISPGAGTEYSLVLSSLKDLKAQMEKLNLKSVAFPYNMGAGIGGGDWYVVYGLITYVFKDSDIDVTICKLPN